MLLVFARLGAALMIVPGFGEQLRPAAPAAAAGAGAQPAGRARRSPARCRRCRASRWRWLRWWLPEILVGLLLGFAARLALAAVHVGGSLIATAVRPVGGGDVRPQRGDARAPCRAPSSPRRRSPSCSPPTSTTCCCARSAASYAAFPVAAPIDLGAAGELLIRLCGDGDRHRRPNRRADDPGRRPGQSRPGRPGPHGAVAARSSSWRCRCSCSWRWSILELSLPAACACSARRSPAASAGWTGRLSMAEEQRPLPENRSAIATTARRGARQGPARRLARGRDAAAVRHRDPARP